MTVLRSLWFRLVGAYLLVVVIAVLTTALVSRAMAGAFFEGHLQDMANDPGMMGAPPGAAVFESLRRDFASSFERSIWMAAAVSAVVALGFAAFAVVRLMRPIQMIRRASRRMARGAYWERVPVPAEAELAALVEDVNSLGAALEQVEERRVQLISEVAHELRTPLSTIQGYMEGLLDGVFEPSDEIYAVTAAEAARLKRLASDLSALSAAEAGSLDLRRDRIDLAAVAAAAAERLRPQFEGQEVALEVDTPASLMVDGDPDRLAQVFVNVVGNALSHTDSGGRVKVSGRRVGGSAQVRVSDSGVGLAADQLELIFERFYRADRNRRGGTGIGLTIARRIARLHGGEVAAASEGPGRGSTFTITIPLAG